MKAKFVRVKVHNISLLNYNFILLLKRDDEENLLPICIGTAEAHAIATALNKKPFARPLTHDLMKTVFETFEIELKEVVINNLQDGVFFAQLICKQNRVHNYD